MLFINIKYQCSSLIANGIYWKFGTCSKEYLVWIIFKIHVLSVARISVAIIDSKSEEKKKVMTFFSTETFCHCVHRKLAKGKPFIICGYV